MFAVLLALLIIYAWWAPSSSFGRWAQRLTVALVERFSRTRPLTIVLFFLFATGLVVLAFYAETEGLLIAAPIAAEGFAYFAAVDVGAALEVMAIAWLLAASGALHTALRTLRSLPWASALWAAAMHRRGRSRRARPNRRRAQRGDPDEDEAPSVFAFA